MVPYTSSSDGTLWGVYVPEAKRRIRDAVRDSSPRPTDLLNDLASSIPYGQAREALTELLETGELELSADLHLRLSSLG
jgi:hypothetical protein